MQGYQGTFKRKEIKYRLTAEQRSAFMEKVALHLQHDEFGLTHIGSLYFDNANNSIICRSMEKPLYKEKLRLRYYGQPAGSEQAFLELKKKFKGIVYKRRIGLTYDAALEFLSGIPYEHAVQRDPLQNARQQAETMSYRSIQISREIDAFIANHGPLHPSMLIECDREAFVESLLYADDMAEARQLRITFDTNIRYTQYEPDERSIWNAQEQNKRMLASKTIQDSKQLLPEGDCIMEIKAMGSYPHWLVETLNQLQIYPTSFSKYGNAFKACAADCGKNIQQLTYERQAVKC